MKKPEFDCSIQNLPPAHKNTKIQFEEKAETSPPKPYTLTLVRAIHVGNICTYAEFLQRKCADMHMSTHRFNWYSLPKTPVFRID